MALLHCSVARGGANGAQKRLSPAEPFESFCINTTRTPYSETITTSVVAVIHADATVVSRICTCYTDLYLNKIIILFCPEVNIYMHLLLLCSGT